MGDTSLVTLQGESDGTTNEAARSANGRGWVTLFLLALILIHAGMNAWWLQTDNHTIRTDEEGHMHQARTYYETLFLKEYDGPVKRLIAVSQIRPGNPAHPPLFHAAGAVMIALFGYSTDTMALTNTVFFILLLLGCYSLARTFLDPWQSLFTVFVVSFTPIIFASSRFFMTDFAAAALVVWGIVALVRSEGFQRSPWVFFFGVLNGLGILTRTITFGYLLFPAVLAVLIGLGRALRHRKDPTPGGPSLGAWAANIVMALTVTVGVFGPWYYTNLEPFYDYWSNKEIGDRRGPLTNFIPDPSTPAPPRETAVAPPPATETAPASQPVPPRVSIDYALERFKNPAVAWIRYPVYLANNGLFIPLALLAVLGMLTAWMRSAFRRSTLVYLFVWIFGSWLFFTVFLRSGTPRYALPVAPALAMFAALFVLALPGRIVRQCVGVLVIAVLLFQYGNITVQPYGALARASLPAPVAPIEREARHFVDDGLVLYKDHLTLSDAYGRLGPPRTDNDKERFFEAMIAHEKTLPVREGKYANYQKLRLRGMPLYERHYWPGENPFRLASLGPEDIPERRFRLIHMGLEPEHLLSRLPDTDYILYQADAAESETVAEWLAFFGQRGFKPVASFESPAFGWVPKRINGVLAREITEELVMVTPETVATMNLTDLHELMESADFARLAPALQERVQSTFQSKLGAIATPFPLHEAVTFLAAEVSKLEADLFQFRLYFRVNKAIDRDWRMLFHGFVVDADLPRLPPEKQEQGYVDWNFDPQPPTSSWEPGSVVVLTHQIRATPMVYQFKFGLFQDNELFGQTALLKPMDLSAIP